MFKVLIADSHPVVRAGYRRFLEPDSLVRHIGEAGSGADLLARLRFEEWHLVLMDIQMPVRNGLDLLHRIVVNCPRTRVLIASGLPEGQYAFSAIRAGAKGYVSKGGAIEDFRDAVRTVLIGRVYISASLAASMVEGRVGRREAGTHSALSPREFLIFSKLAAGATVGAVAQQLEISSKTVSTYRSRIFRKMRLTSNADMTRYALRNGLIH